MYETGASFNAAPRVYIIVNDYVKLKKKLSSWNNI